MNIINTVLSEWYYNIQKRLTYIGTFFPLPNASHISSVAGSVSATITANTITSVSTGHISSCCGHVKQHVLPAASCDCRPLLDCTEQGIAHSVAVAHKGPNCHL